MTKDEQEEQFKEMLFYNHVQDDTSDGAFFAMAEEIHGWTVDDWSWFAEECEKRGTYK